MTEPLLSFEDFSPGMRIDLGACLVDRAEMIAFAAEFDPQPMHLGEGDADGLLGGLAASGWYTAALFMRMLCDGLLLKARGLGAPGVDRLQWKAPVRAGDRLATTAEVLDTRTSRSRPEIGIVRFRFDVANGDGVTVMTLENSILFSRREVAA